MTAGRRPAAGRPPVVVAPDAVAAADAGARLRAEGWTVTGPLEVPAAPWDLSDRGVVVSATVDDAAVADVVLLAARGAGLVVVLDVVDPVTAEAFLDQLVRIGPVQVVEALHPRGPARRLTAEEATLLEALADGAGTAEAAARLFISLRTANRRLASARAALRVDSTRAAVVAHMATRTRTRT